MAGELLLDAGEVRAEDGLDEVLVDPVRPPRVGARGLVLREDDRGQLPLVAVPGRPAVLTTPDGVDADRALDPDGVYENWPRTVAARSILGLPLYRPIRDAGRVACPLLVVSCDEDRSAPAGPDVEAARRAPRGELLRLRGGHYAPFLAGFEEVVTAEIAFLRRHLLAPDARTL